MNLIEDTINLLKQNEYFEDIKDSLHQKGYNEEDWLTVKGYYEDYELVLNRVDHDGISFQDACDCCRRWLDEQKLKYVQEFYNSLNSRYEILEEPKSIKGTARTPWYNGPRSSDKFWPNLLRSFETLNWADKDLDALKSGSSKVLSLCHNPNSQKFKTIGLVVGYVQSGKTANMSAVISKAADRGFKVFIVLSGLTNALRGQTQERLTKDIVSLNQSRWHSWTDENDLRDQAILSTLEAMLSGNKTRHLAVVKKNPSVLRRLIGYLKNISEPTLRKTPVLIIDDETDQASVNSSKYREQASTINLLINKLVKLFPKVAFIGYTATPYANILINPQAEDLYPKDFITALKRPSKYFGAERLFGRDLLENEDDSSLTNGMDMIRIIPPKESELLEPPKNKEERINFHMTMVPSMETAINYFFISMAIRHLRNNGDSHMTMMIHTTRYTAPHKNAVPIIKNHKEKCLELIDSNDNDFKSKIKAIWEYEKEKVLLEDIGCTPLEEPKFDSIWKCLKDCIFKTEVIAENSESEERIDFRNEAKKYIIIGGDVLARGLTVEGLMVSYFLRHSSTYDALMQMGRWFGFRVGYEDLPRVWMTDEMRDKFKDLATVEQEIRNDIEYLASRDDVTPMQFAVRIRTHPSLAITSRNKMLDAKVEYCNFSSHHKQTFKFNNDLNWLEQNWQAGENLISNICGKGIDFKATNNCFSSLKVPVNLILNFFGEYQIHKDHLDFPSQSLIKFIEKKITSGSSELEYWSVTLVSNQERNGTKTNFGPLENISMTNRSCYRRLPENTIDIKALVSRFHYTVDLDENLAGSSWEDIQNYRKNNYNFPCLLLYPINKNSKPREKSAREDLEGVHNILGIGLMFPELSTIQSEASEYVSADIPLNENDDDLDNY